MSEMEPKVVLPAYVLKKLHFSGNILRVKQSALAYFVSAYKLPPLPFAIYQSEMEQEQVPDLAQLLVAEESSLTTFHPNNVDPEH